MIGPFFHSIQDRWMQIHPFFRFLCLLAVLAAFGLFGARPGYHRFKAWRLERNLVAARHAVEEERMDEARDLSLTVLRAGDPRLEAFQILERSTAALRDPLHAEIARALMAHPEGSDEDRWTGFRGIASELPLGVVGQAWAKLPSDCQVAPRFVTAFAERLLAEGRLREAASILLAVAGFNALNPNP